MSLTETEIQAARNVMASILPNLTEIQVESVIRRMNKIVHRGKPADYAFVMATMRHKPHAKAQAR